MTKSKRSARAEETLGQFRIWQHCMRVSDSTFCIRYAQTSDQLFVAIQRHMRAVIALIQRVKREKKIILEDGR